MPLKLHTALENYFESFLKQIKWLSEVHFDSVLPLLQTAIGQAASSLRNKKTKGKYDEMWQITITHTFFFIFFLLLPTL